MKRQCCAHDSRMLDSSRNIRLMCKTAFSVFILLAAAARPAAAADIEGHTDLVHYQGEDHDDMNEHYESLI